MNNLKLFIEKQTVKDLIKNKNHTYVFINNIHINFTAD